jgi:hypothetical protein
MTEHPPFEKLVALWAAELSEDEAAPIDEHLFACDRCAARSEELARLVGGLRELIPLVISHALRDRLVQSGKRVRVLSVEPDISERAQFTPEVDVFVFALRGDLSRAERVDVEMVSASGSPRYHLEQVPFDRATGEVLVACQARYEGMFPANDPVFRVHAIVGGERKHVGDYVVQHVWR